MLKTKSKTLALFITLILLLNMILPVMSNAVEDTTIGIYNTAGEDEPILVKEGDTFSVDVKFENPIQDAHALTGIVKFDSSKLEIVNKAPYDGESYVITGIGNIGASINISEWHEGSDEIGFAHTSDFGNIRGGTSITVEFRVKDGATGTFDISLQNVVYADARTAQEVVYPITTEPQTITGTIETPLDSISLNKTETTIGVGSSEILNVTYHPEETTDDKTVTWVSDNNAIATVDNQGNVTAVAPGDAVITATVGNAKASCTVHVTSELLSIAINKSEVELAKGQTEQLSINYNPQNTTDSKEVTWESSNPEVATVDPNTGLVTAIENGTTTITATSVVDGVEPATCTVNVSTKLQYIFFEGEDLTSMNRGDEETLTVGYYPADTTDDRTITWTSTDESVATVVDGKITALKIGTTTIIASCNGKTVETTIEVKAPLVSIDIGENFELDPLQEKQLTVTYNPDDTTDSRTVTWESSDEEVATVVNGKVTALKPGTTEITATCGNITDSITVTVNEVPLTGIAINTPSTTIAKGETETLSVIFYPDNTTDDRTIIWTSEDDTIATVENGVVTAVGVGTTTIKAQVGIWEATCEVEVNAPLKGITLDKNKVTLNKGTAEDTVELNVIYNPTDTTDNKDVTWTSKNQSVATVENGIVTAVGAGTAIIEAKVGEFTATCEVEVKVPLTGISIKDSTELIKNQSETLVVTYEPADTTDDRTVTWTSSDEAIAKIDENGKVTALKEGTVTITAKVGEYTDECEVTVKEIKLEGITINNTIDTLIKGQSAQLGVIYTPDNTTDNKVATWTSSDETIATIDENGKVTALKAGTVTITATSGNFTDSFELTVEEIALTGIEIKTENDKTALKEGETLQLDINFLPENTTDSKDVVYISSNESVITVDENGKVTAIKPGTAVVTVVAENGIKTQIELTVEQEEVVEEPEKEQEVVESPQTGDINIVFYIGLMVVSLVGIVKSIRRRK